MVQWAPGTMTMPEWQWGGCSEGNHNDQEKYKRKGVMSGLCDP